MNQKLVSPVEPSKLDAWLVAMRDFPKSDDPTKDHDLHARQVLLKTTIRGCYKEPKVVLKVHNTWQTYNEIVACMYRGDVGPTDQFPSLVPFAKLDATFLAQMVERCTDITPDKLAKVLARPGQLGALVEGLFQLSPTLKIFGALQIIGVCKLYLVNF